MIYLQNINKIVPYIDDAFTAFYDEMLSDPKLSIFFENDAQITHLIKTQKAYFIKSLEMSKDEIESSYVKLGEYHYDLRIPYVDFIKGAQMLEEYFLLHATKTDSSKEIIDDIIVYFDFMKSYTAKGYLNRMIQEDKKDIDKFFNLSQEEISEPMLSKNSKIKWLRKLLDTIDRGDDIEIDNIDKLLDAWLGEIEKFSLKTREFIEDLEKRILINTQNLFYFLKRKDYLEILPLYTSLLEIYKLTLLLNNIVTVELANKAIENLRIDVLSKLLRKESFLEFLSKEVSYAKREENYIFSVAYLDLDNFKYINDNFGHYSGDKVIEKFGEIVRNSIRGSDIAFRIGGDEFAVIFKNTTRKNAKIVCQKIKVELSSYEFVFNENRVFKVETSIGIIEFDKNLINTCEDMIKLADEKLYDAKKSGKNQIAY